MAQLLHIDTSIQGEHSVSRALTARAAQRWRQLNPDGVVTYRDLGAHPVPHLTDATASPSLIPAGLRTAAQVDSYALSAELIDEVKRADAVVMGLPLYNYGPPSSVKSWVDHIVAAGLSFDPERNVGLLGDTEFIVVESRGGGYGAGTPREGWDHAHGWFPHAVSLTGLVPRIIVAELTLAAVNPALAEFRELGAQSLAGAQREIDALWADAGSAVA